LLREVFIYWWLLSYIIL